MLRHKDIITNKSGYMSRNISIAIYLIQNHTNHLRATINVNPYFQEFFSRKQLYLDNDIAMHLLCTNLLKLALDKIQSVHDSHFVQ